MKLKTVTWCLCGVMLFILFNKIAGISHQDVRKGLISDEERRGIVPTDQIHSKSQKRGIYTSSSKLPSYPSGYGHTGYPYPPSSGHGYPAYEPDHGPTGYGYGSSYGPSGPSGYHHSGPSGDGYVHKEYPDKGIALKTLLLPLAGIALLGVAASLTTNPVLLQLGVVNGRRRRRRSIYGQVYPENPYVRPE